MEADAPKKLLSQKIETLENIIKIKDNLIETQQIIISELEKRIQKTGLAFDKIILLNQGNISLLKKETEVTK